MPPAKRSSSASSQSKPATKRPATGQRATKAAAAGGAKGTATSARKAASRTATQAKSGASKTANATTSGAAKTRRAARSGGTSAAAKSAGAGAATTAKTARAGAKGTATAAKRGAKTTATTAKAATTRAKKASGSDSITGVAEQLVKGTIKPRDLVVLTRERIQEAVDDAASRGRVTRKDANELAADLVRRGRHQSDDLLSEIEGLLGKGRTQLGTATKRARSSEPVDRIVRGADRARRAAGVGPSFPILGYDDLNAGQVQTRLKDLSKPDLRKVLTYERKNSNRKTVVGAIEKSLA